jgi:PAS domain S-box-containing protein
MDENIKSSKSDPTDFDLIDHAHAVQFFESDTELNDKLLSFFLDGLRHTEAAIIIATPKHRVTFEASLDAANLNVKSLKHSGQLILLDAEETLSSFMLNGLPDPVKFEKIIGSLFDKTSARFSEINAYGEMVGLLWDEGNTEGTIYLEQLWNDLSKTRKFKLLCGYGHHQFSAGKDADGFDRICAEHSHVVNSLPTRSPQSSSHAVAMLRQRDEALQKELQRRIQTEADLITSKAALDDFFDNAAIGLHWVGPDGTILRANRHELELLGYTEKEYIGHNIAEFHADADVISGMLEKLSRQETLLEHPARLKCKNGSIKHVLVTSNVYWKDGKFVHTRCFTRDVTHEIEIEHALSESEILKEAILNSSEDSIQVLDTEARLEFMNPGGLRAVGITNFDLIKGKYWFDFFQGQSHENAKRVFTSALSGKSDHFTPEIVSEDGKARRYWSIVAAPIRNSEGSVNRVLITSRDITDQYLAQKERQERQAKQTEDKYRLIIESIRDYAIFMLDPSGNVTTWNEGAKRAKGYEQNEILGKHFSAFYPASEKESKPYRLLEEAKHLGRAEDEGWRVRKDGTQFWANVVITALFDENKTLVGFAKVTRDLSERKKSEDELRSVHQKVEDQARTFDIALSASHDFYYLFDTNHRFTYANQSLLKLWGKTLDEVVGKNFKDLGYPDNLVKLHQQQLNETLTGKVVKGENAYTNAEGKTGYYEYTFIPILDLKGNITAVSGTTRDVTVERELMQTRLDEQKRLFEFAEADRREKILANERENFRNLFKQTPEMVCILNGPKHIFEFVNKAHVKILGFDATGKTVREAQPESVEVHGILDDVYRTGDTAELKEIPITIGNKVRHFNLTFSARRDDKGAINGIMILGTEVTSELEFREELRKAKAEAEKANDLKSAFLANMSHEIRTPLGAMVGFADLLRDPGLSREEHSNYISILTRNGEQLSTIINDILDLSKVEAGHLTLDFHETSPSEIAADIVSLLRVKANEKDVVLEFRAEASTQSLVVTDSLRVRQILLNVVGNAIKFTQAGSVKIRSFGSENAALGKMLYFEVTDTGIGIPDSEKYRIFDAFVQADGTLVRRFGGTGLGLALSRQLARSLGGDISVTKTIPGKGSTFLISIQDQPEKRTPDSVRIEKPDHTVLPEDLLAGFNILVVDDSPDNRQLIWHLLTKFGAAVDFAENGILGYRKALAGKFDVVLMDIQMPEMDGYTATAKLRDAGYQKPIIALTAHAMSEVRKKCLLVGCSDHLPKPIKQNELVRSVAKYCKVNGLSQA